MGLLLDLLEPEELIGRHWHRLVGQASSWPRFPEAAVELAAMKRPLAVVFRALGGPVGAAILGESAQTSGHRLGWRMRLGVGAERLARARFDASGLHLPPCLDVLPEPGLNAGLYLWLAVFFACRPPRPDPGETDPLRRDVAFLRGVRAASRAALEACPGLAPLHRDLCEGLLRLRPHRALPPDEAELERAVRALLGGAGEGGRFWPAICGQGLDPSWRAPRGYRGILPVPLWGEALDLEPGLSAAPDTAPAEPASAAPPATEGAAVKAKRRPADQAERKDSLILNRFEKILTLIESLNINRAVDDDDEEGARKALDDAEEIGLARISKKAATRLKFDLDLAPAVGEHDPLAGEFTYPEWDWRRQDYHPRSCRVVTGTAATTGESWTPDAATLARIRRVRRQFEALRPRPEILRGQADGPELDLDAVVRAQADRKAGGPGSERIYLDSRHQGRDLAVSLLVDVSLSTDSWIADRRILDIEKEALSVLAHGLAACGDDHAILTFTSRRRDWVRVETVKDFDEPFGPKVTARIAALKPGYYTRIGAALRHGAAGLALRPNRHRLLLVLTDGKPNDVDHYEGRFGIEDTRRAVGEARRAGIKVFGVTVDGEARAYFPAIFGQGGYAIISDPARLPAALPGLYRHLIAR